MMRYDNRLSMPSPVEMADRAIKEVRNIYSSQKRKNVSDPKILREIIDNIIIELLEAEYREFLNVERKIKSGQLADLLRTFFKKGQSYSADEIVEIISSHFSDLDRFYLSAGQSRKARAGGSLERHLEWVFQVLGYPFEKQQVINGTPDFIFPSANLYRKQPADCVLLTAKRTLRERWRQIVPEGRKFPQYYLATIDPKISSTQLKEMRDNRVYLVIPEPIIDSVPSYKKEGNVISFKAFLDDYLDPVAKRWGKVISKRS